MSTGGGRFREQDSRFVIASSQSTGCVGEVCKNQENGGKSLDSIRDDISEEIRMKMSTGAGHFPEQEGQFVHALSKHTGCFGKVQVN